MDAQKPLKIQTKQAINVGRSITGSNYIEIDPDLSLLDSIKNVNTDDYSKDYFSSFIEEFGLENRFYYRIELYDSIDSDHADFTELGIGHLIYKDEKYLLHRKEPIAFMQGDSQPVPITTPQTQITKTNDRNIILVSSIYPENIFDAIGDPHSIVYSNEYYKLNPLIVNNDCLIGRLSDSIVNIPISDLFNDFLKLLQSSVKKISLKAKQLVVNKISSNSLELKPRVSAEEVAGSLYFDKEKSQFRFYDGKTWRIIVSEVDEE